MDVTRVAFCIMKTLSKSKLKPRLLEIMRGIEDTGEELMVTDLGRPTLLIRPYREHRPLEELFAAERDRLVFHEKPDAPTACAVFPSRHTLIHGDTAFCMASCMYETEGYVPDRRPGT